MLHRYRTAMVRPGRERLRTTVELDETFLGGPEPGRAVARWARRWSRWPSSGRAPGSAAAAWPSSTTRAPPVCTRSSSPTSSPPRSSSATAWAAYPRACGADYRHEPLVIRGFGSAAHELLPGRLPGRRGGEALASWHPPGRREAGSPPGLPRRVHVSLQSPALTGAGDALLPLPRKGRRGEPTHVSLARCGSRLRPLEDAGSPLRQAGQERQPGRRAP